MKKVLLATSILAASAGFASAEIALSGSARMGIVHKSNEGVSGETFFSSRVRIVFTASGETDGGLSFGASMRADQDGGNSLKGTRNGDSTVFISGAFGKLTMGDVSGAADSLVGQVSGVGYGPNDALQEIDFVGVDNTAVYYEYSAGALTFGLGVGQTYFSETDAETRNTASIGVKYSAGGYSVALAYEQADDIAATLLVDEAEELISLGASAAFGPATVKARISDSDIVGKDTTYALSVDYVTGATTITAFYTDFGNTGASTDTQHVGIGASYDLGGGAKLAGGIVQQMNDAATGDETFADVGVKFSF